ncbi:MAG: hydantoinase/oxoprolinase family protein, partial [Deltaproteobacteria bacterium]|nr:hydantoinase/oxoprolinase family protein [Deltaproteobacteria bacterium]
VTTALNPIEGIRKALAGLPKEKFVSVNFVSLATTFATNAIVEGKGGQAGLILIGYDPEHPRLKGMSPMMHLHGGHDCLGREKETLNLDELQNRLPAFCEGLDAIAVSGFFSVRNPDHELKVAQIVKDRTGLPVACGHMLSSKLGAIERAITVWWNARLISMINGLIQSTLDVMQEFGLSVPLMIVKGDGTLLSAEQAQKRPVETILSGPGASIIGARHLSGRKDALVVDMGGTTTDMAILSGGRVEVDPEGAIVGSWKTHVKAARVRTIGLGGDSIFSTADGTLDRLTVGPRRVEPLCVFAKKFPEIVNILEQINHEKNPKIPYFSDPCTFYVAACAPDKSSDPLPVPFIKGPVNEYRLLSGNSLNLMSWDLERLETSGKIIRAALTPTDLLVATGQFRMGNPKAATLGLSVFANRLKVDKGVMADMLAGIVKKKICLTAAEHLAGRNADAISALLDCWFDSTEPADDTGPQLRHRLSLTHPVIGIGAPAAAWLPGAFEHLHSQCDLPESFSVGTAVGAVVGMVDITLKAEVRPLITSRFVLYTPSARSEFGDLEQAVSAGRSIIEKLALERMRKNRVAEPVLQFFEKRKAVDTSFGEIYMATELRLRAFGRIQV